MIGIQQVVRQGEGRPVRQPQSAPSRPDKQFFQRVAEADAQVLMLDYDGTLAPFRVKRANVVPYSGVRQVLSEIMLAGRTRLVIVTGRALDDLVSLLNVDPLPEIWASHGWECRNADGCYQLFAVPESAKEGLELALRRAHEGRLGSRVEEKPASIALHWRGRSRAAAGSLREWALGWWGPLAKSHRLDLRDFDGGLELRVPGRDKGTAVRTILSKSPPNAVAAYLGDDLTDEDAFLAVPKEGLSVLVRRELRPTAAKSWIQPPKELLAFLWRWKSVAEGRA